MTRLLPPAAGTEIDYAFFVDLAMNMTISPSRITHADQAVKGEEGNRGRRLTPSEKRRTIGESLVSELSNQVEDRRGRNVVYYVDGVGKDALSRQELDAWRQRSGIRASDVGLTDELFTW